MARYNFTNITLNSTADITDVMNNFNKVEDNGAIIDDLPKTKQITITANGWVEVDEDLWQYTVSEQMIQAEPYNIDVIFNDLSEIEASIYPKPNSQANGSIVLYTSSRPTVDLTARLIVTKGVQQ